VTSRARYFTIVLSGKRPDGQYGICPVCVEATDIEAAKKQAIAEAEEDGITEVKVQFTL
jgi:hypothetical protein